MSGSLGKREKIAIAFELSGKREYLYRPHPGKEATGCQIEAIRAFLQSTGAYQMMK